MTTELRHAPERYSAEVWAYFNDGAKDDDGIRNYSSKVVRTRKEQECAAGQHPIPPGSQAVREVCIMDEKWMSCYTCCACVDGWIAKDEARGAELESEAGEGGER